MILGFVPLSKDVRLCGVCFGPVFRRKHEAIKEFMGRKKCGSCNHLDNKLRPKKHATLEDKQKAVFASHRKRTCKKYGLTVEAYDAIWAAQDGMCAACHRTEAEAGLQKLCVDHDHACCPGKRSCGKCVRALLCSDCNRALGILNDDPRRIADLQFYITNTVSGTTGKV